MTDVEKSRLAAELFDVLDNFKWWDYGLDDVHQADREYARDLSQLLAETAHAWHERQLIPSNKIDGSSAFAPTPAPETKPQPRRLAVTKHLSECASLNYPGLPCSCDDYSPEWTL